MAKPKTRIGHVGAFKRFSEYDQSRLVEVASRLLRLDPDYAGPKEHVKINLKYGRDFLKEEEKYDVVILHSIFHPSSGSEHFTSAKHGVTMLSPLHNEDRWRERLVSTGAKWIAVCEGQSFCLSGWQLGKLYGYDLVEIDTRVAIYRKLDEKDTLPTTTGEKP